MAHQGATVENEPPALSALDPESDAVDVSIDHDLLSLRAEGWVYELRLDGRAYRGSGLSERRDRVTIADDERADVHPMVNEHYDQTVRYKLVETSTVAEYERAVEGAGVFRSAAI